MNELQAPIKLNIELFNDYIAWLDRPQTTIKTYIVGLRQFAAWLQFEGIDEPKREDLINFRDYLSRDHDTIMLTESAPGWKYKYADGKRITGRCSPATIALYLTALKQFFAWTAERGLYPDITSHVRAPKVSKEHKKEALTPADVAAIEEYLNKQIRNANKPIKEEQARRLLAIFLLEVNNGLRNIEISRANIKDVKIINNTPFIFVWGKGHSEPDERLPLAPGVYDAIREYLKLRRDKSPNAPLFTATGNRSGGQAIEPRTISTMLKRALRAAGYDSDRITAHSLRHTAGTTALNVTGDLLKTQRFLRHQNPATTEIYLHVNTDKMNQETANLIYDTLHERSSQHGNREP